MEYDFIIVGSGASGSMVAHTISEELNEQVKILIIERGDFQYTEPQTYWYEKIGLTYSSTDVYREEKTIPQKHLCNRRINIKQGNLEGGLTSGNGAVAIPGDITDYQDWPGGWKWDDLYNSLQYIKKKFTIQPMYHNTLFDIIRHSTIMNHGYDSLRTDEDINEGSLNGIGYVNMYINKQTGERKSAAQVLLRKSMRKNKNINFLNNAEVVKIKFKDTAKSIVIYHNNSNKEIRLCNGGHVILCAGAIETPRILLRSGIGDKEKVLGKCYIENKNVGCGLQDQVGFPIIYRINQQPKLSECLTIRDSLKLSKYQWGHLSIILSIIFGFILAMLFDWSIIYINPSILHDHITVYFIKFMLGMIIAFISVYLNFWSVLLGLMIWSVFLIVIGIITGLTFLSMIIGFLNGTLIINIYHYLIFFIAFYLTVYWISIILNRNKDANNSLSGFQLWSFLKKKETIDYESLKKMIKIKNEKKELKIQMYFQTGFYFGDFLPGTFIDFSENKFIKKIFRWIIWILIKVSLAKYWLFSRMVNVIITVARPKSRGYVDLKHINPNYLDDDEDIKNLKEAVKEINKIMLTEEMKSTFNPRQFMPIDKNLMRMIKLNARTMYHLVGTCSMGVDPCNSVVDSNGSLNIHGLNNVHIMDSSVLPSITSTSNSMIIMAIARRATIKMIRSLGTV